MLKELQKMMTGSRKKPKMLVLNLTISTKTCVPLELISSGAMISLKTIPSKAPKHSRTEAGGKKRTLMRSLTTAAKTVKAQNKVATIPTVVWVAAPMQWVSSTIAAGVQTRYRSSPPKLLQGTVPLS